ncbi:hypothetical protein SKB0092_42570 (plasmid) [Roseomonas mucosa]
MTGRGNDTQGTGSYGRADRAVPSEGGQPHVGPPPIFFSQLRHLLRSGRYLRSVLVEQEPAADSGNILTVYVVGSWHPDWHVFSDSETAVRRSFRSLDRLLILLRTQFGFQGDVVVRTRRLDAGRSRHLP